MCAIVNIVLIVLKWAIGVLGFIFYGLWRCVKPVLLKLFRPDEETRNKEQKQKEKFVGIFPECCGKCFPSLLEMLYQVLVKSLKVYNGISFVIFFFTMVSYNINFMNELTLEALSTKRNSALHILYIICTFMLLLSFVFNSLYMLSLFWDVVDVVRVRSGLEYDAFRSVLFLVDLIGGLASPRGLTGMILTSYIKDLVLTIFCSVFLIFCVYTERNTNIFPRNTMKSFGNVCYCIGIFSFLIIAIGASVVYGLSKATATAISFSVLCPIVSLVILYLLRKRGSRKKESGFVLKFGVFSFMASVYVLLIVLSSITHYQCGPECQLDLPIKNSASKQRRDAQNSAKIPGYSMCGKKWSKLVLSITDMAFLANLAYKINNDGNEAIISALLNDNFAGRGIKWEIESVNPKKPSFYHIRSFDHKVHVIGIRGTSDGRDWLENLKIWNEIAIFQIFFGYLSIKNIPDIFVSHYVGLASVMDYYFYHHNSYVQKLEEYIKREIYDNQNEEFVLVGHSLGGGLAKIVGTRQKIPSIGFSSPGEVYNHIKYGYTLDDLEKYTTSFGSRDDIISWIDKPGGLVQNVECDNCGFFDVHSIRNTYDNLKKKCP